MNNEAAVERRQEETGITRTYSGVPVITLEEFHARLKAQGVPKVHLAFVCPMCGVVQSAADLIAAGAGADFASVEGFVGFSCIGRWTKGGPPRRKPDGKPCNWTLGGLLPICKLIVKLPDGKEQITFEPATPEQAQAYFTAKGGAL